jgi:hypothetical protein
MGGNISKRYISTGPYADIYIQLDQPFFYAGQVVSGKIHLDVHQQFPAGQLTFTIKGKEKVHWITERTDTKVTTDSNNVQHTEHITIKIPHRGKNIIMNATAPLFSFPTFLVQGQYSIPFSMKIPEHFPGTFDIKGVDEAFSKIKEVSIKYTIYALLMSMDMSIKNLGYKMPLKIRPLIGNEILKSTDQRQEGTVTKCCSDKGRCELRATFGKSVYALGEIVEMNAIADNTNSVAKMVSIRASLRQHISIQANKEGVDNFVINNEVASSEQFIQLQSGQVMKESVRLAFTIANKFMKDAKGTDMVQPTVNGTIVKCTYMISVYINFEGCCVMGPEIKFPIALYAPEFQNPQPIQPPMQWNPVQCSMGQILFTGQQISISGFALPMEMPSVNAQMNIGQVSAPQVQANMEVNANINPPQINMEIGGNANIAMNLNMPGMTVQANVPNMDIKMN